MDTNNVLPTRGQLERYISQTLQSLYRSQFGQLPSKITCHIFDDKVAIVAENVTTDLEKILSDNSKLDLASNIRSAIDETFVANVKQQIADILGVEVTELIVDSVLDTGYLGIILFLSDLPKMRLAAKEQLKITKLIRDTSTAARK